jgi:exodeoxyribonuclease VII large subunit
VPGQIKSSLHHFLSHRLQYLRQTQKSTGIRAKSIVKEESQRLHQFETANHLLDPVHVLKRGYTLTFRDGKLIKTSTLAEPGDILTTKWFDGTVQSKVDTKSGEF